MMGSKYNACDFLFALFYIFIAQLMYIMASNPNKCKDQKPGVAGPGRWYIFANIY